MIYAHYINVVNSEHKKVTDFNSHLYECFEASDVIGTLVI